MNGNHVDVARALAYISGGSLGILATALSTAFPTHAGQIAAYTAIVLFVSGLLLNVYYNRSVPAGTQPVITSADATTPLRVKDLTTPAAVAEQESKP